MKKNDAAKDAVPWYRHGHVWLVIAGPALVVVASFVSAYLAISRPDPVIDADYYRRGMEINKTLAANARAKLPALEGRNHAATPAEP